MEELTGLPMHPTLHHTRVDGTHYPREECPIYAAFTDGAVHRVTGEVFWCKDGTGFPVEYASTPVREDGRLIEAVVTFRDTTERQALEAALGAVCHHHERWDGGGYPLGLKEKETPLMARLMAVVDAFSAMTTGRPYRLGMDRAKALSILSAGAGTQWDPQCVAAFLLGLGETERPVARFGQVTSCSVSSGGPS